MQKLRVATWNMDNWKQSNASRGAGWKWLQDTVQPDIALLQETIPSSGVEQVVWKEDGIDKNRPWASAVVSFGPRIREIRRWKGPYNKRENDLHRTQPGTLSVAQAELPHQDPIVVVSMYGMSDDGYTTTTVHRQLSDLAPLLNSSQGKRIIIGSDLNCSTQFLHFYGRIHRNLFERFKVYGLVNLTDATKDQRPSLDNCPCEEGPGCGHVQTHRHSKSDIPWQDDYIFASSSLASKMTTCKVIDEGLPSPWEFSDHCPVVADFDL